MTGRGVEAIVDGSRIAVGGPALLRELSSELPSELSQWAEQQRGRGAAVLSVIRDGRVVGVITLEDEVRPESLDAVRGLHKEGVRVVMITGDAQQVAEAVAADLDVDEVMAEVLPEDKAAAVAALSARDAGRDGWRRRQRRAGTRTG